jgi:kynurenine aminotransferase
MFERTITVGSCGKMFGITGWKIGWVISSPGITRAIWMIHQYACFCVATPLQDALHRVFEEAAANGFYVKAKATYKSNRELLYGFFFA